MAGRRSGGGEARVPEDKKECSVQPFNRVAADAQGTLAEEKEEEEREGNKNKKN